MCLLSQALKCCVNPPRARDFSRPHLFISDPLLHSASVDSPKDSGEDEDEADKRGFSRPRSFSPSAKVDTEKTNKREPSKVTSANKLIWFLAPFPPQQLKYRVSKSSLEK